MDSRKGPLDGLLQTRHSAPFLLRYLLGLVVCLITFAVRLLIQPITPWSPFLLFIPGLMLVSWLWGRGPALFYLATTTVAGSMYFVPRPGEFHLTDPIEVATSVQFILVALVVMLIVERLAAARQELTTQLRSIRQLNGQQQILLDEINHRVKNHLQTIIALVPSGQDERLDQIRLRMLVLARAYDKLRLRADGAELDPNTFVAELTTDFQDSLAPNRRVRIESSVHCGPLGSKEAVFLGLIANEAVTNALKYAFPSGHGEIAISLLEQVDQRTLVIRDDGAGDSGTIKGGGQGRKLIDRLAKELGGVVLIEGSPGHSVSVTYPAPYSAQQ